MLLKQEQARLIYIYLYIALLKREQARLVHIYFNMSLCVFVLSLRAKMVELDDQWRALESARLTLLRQEQAKPIFISISIRFCMVTYSVCGLRWLSWITSGERSKPRVNPTLLRQEQARGVFMYVLMYKHSY